MSKRMPAVLAIVGALSLATAAPASAATFTVNPTQIFLSGRTTTALLTLRNDSDEPLRFQLSAFAWQQTASGELSLTATQDVVFFPALLTLGPKEERRVRVGSTVPATAQERTYRIFVEELPPSAGAGDASAVRVLTKMGIPIFVRPAKETASVDLRDLSVNGGVVRFSVANSGTVHFVPQKVVVRGVGAANEPVFERELQAWYILAGGRREFELGLGAPECARVTSLKVDVEFNSTVLEERLQLPGGACGQ